MLKAESTRNRDMFEAGELTHPYDAWLGVSSWEGGSCAYQVCVDPADPKRVLVFELYGVRIPELGDFVLLYDFISLDVDGIDQTRVTPAPMRYPDHVETREELQMRGANSLDPLVTMLRLLHDASVPIRVVEAPAKLNRARRKAGRFEIPAHRVVEAKDYVTAFLGRGRAASKHPGAGGTHASPVAHWRRRHTRTLESGKVVTVRESKVNFRDAETVHRIFYRVKEDA
jgi:hypothetical protein